MGSASARALRLVRPRGAARYGCRPIASPPPRPRPRDRSSGVSGRPRPVRSHACLLVRPRGPSRLPLPPAASRAAGRGRRARLPFAALARPTDKRLR
ncbi:hypothetical protein CWD92_08135 [Burkholderia thailandensis]|nr:hypothetical protein CWD92_08135 [Burkholderia thailandensis]